MMNLNIQPNKYDPNASSKGEFWVYDFFRVNGYDERIMAYGHDDTNLKDRTVMAGLIKKVFSYNQLHYIPHPQETRTTNQDMVHPMVKTYENRIAARAKTLWTSTDKALQYSRIAVARHFLL
jgi:hypothetical protein